MYRLSAWFKVWVQWQWLYFLTSPYHLQACYLLSSPAMCGSGSNLVLSIQYRAGVRFWMITAYNTECLKEIGLTSRWLHTRQTFEKFGCNFRHTGTAWSIWSDLENANVLFIIYYGISNHQIYIAIFHCLSHQSISLLFISLEQNASTNLLIL